MFDTHCHLNFSAFKKKLDEVILQAKQAGVTRIVIPGTDIISSQKAVEIAAVNNDIYAAVGIHPHHVYEMKLEEYESKIKSDLVELEKLLPNEKVVAVGEVGVDRHTYEKTKYEGYTVDDSFIELQKKALAAQIQLAVSYKKSLIIHNREAKQDLFAVLNTCWDRSLEKKTVFHCCEPDRELFNFAKKHQIFLGIDGDITYSEAKQTFIKNIGAEEFLSRYVLETDAPFLLPEALRLEKKYPNKPENIPLIARFIAELLEIDVQQVIERTSENGAVLFQLPQK